MFLIYRSTQRIRSLLQLCQSPCKSLVILFKSFHYTIIIFGISVQIGYCLRITVHFSCYITDTLLNDVQLYSCF